MIGSTLLGLLSGLVGNVVTAFTNYKTQKLKNEHEIALIDAETKAMIAETQANIKVTETKVAGEVEKLETSAYLENLKLGNRREVSSKMIEKLFDSPWTLPLGVLLVFLLGVVDVLKGFMRPGLTLFMTIVTVYLTMQAVEIMGNEILTATEAANLVSRIIDTVVYLTVTCVVWWFGDRRVAKFLYRLNDGNKRD